MPPFENKPPVIDFFKPYFIYQLNSYGFQIVFSFFERQQKILQLLSVVFISFLVFLVYPNGENIDYFAAHLDI